MTDLEACIILNMIGGIGLGRIRALISFAGSPSAIFRLSESELQRVNGISSVLASKLLHWEDQIDFSKEMQMIERGGVTILTQMDEGYPALLKEIHDAPVCLYVRGTLPAAPDVRTIAMVGTRVISNYGKSVARHFAESAAYSGWITVSGLALGVDTVIHQATVQAGGRTVAVLGGGLARLHPQENLRLAQDIVATGGAVVSEFPMTLPPTRFTFPMRNRIVSGMSRGTVVIEAGSNSGSLITAALSIEQGRRVFAVPGNIDMARSQGCNDLIRKGAVLVQNFEQVIEEFDFLPGFASASSDFLHDDAGSFGFDDAGPDSGDSAVSSLGPVADAVLNVLKKGDASVDRLSMETGYSAQEIMAAAIALEIVSRAKRNPDGTYRRMR